MRRSIGHDVLAVGQIQEEVDGFLRRRVEGFETFFETLYKQTVLTIVHEIEALDAASPKEPCLSVRVSLPQVTPSGDASQEIRVRYRDKWSKEVDSTARVSIEGGTVPGDATPETLTPRASIATPFPEFEFGDVSGTPPSRTLRASFAFSQATWGDRFRSITPLDSPTHRPNPVPDPQPAAATSPVEPSPEPEPEEALEQEALEQEAMRDVQLSPFPMEIETDPTPTEPIAAPVDGEARVEETLRKASMIPKPPTAPISTIQRMKDLVTLVDQAPTDLMELTQPTSTQPQIQAEKQDETEKLGNINRQLKTFVEPPKPAEGRKIAAGNHRLKVESALWAEAEGVLCLKVTSIQKAAAAKKEADKKTADRKLRQAEFKQKIQLKQSTLPYKAAGKPDGGHLNGTKRPTAVEPSPSKKQKLENPRRVKKISHQPPLNGRNVTPSPPSDGGKAGVPAQYNLTPVGELATDTRVKRHERRREKYVPAWADQMALQNSALQQKSKDTSKIFPPLATLDPKHVFGTPDSMVVRNAAERTYRYEHRAPSSCDWSHEEED